MNHLLRKLRLCEVKATIWRKWDIKENIGSRKHQEHEPSEAGTIGSRNHQEHEPPETETHTEVRDAR